MLKSKFASINNQIKDFTLLLKGSIKVEHYSAEFNNKRELIRVHKVRNGITDTGRNKILNVMFTSDTQITTWYVGLINNTPAPTLAGSDTIGSHAGWVESTDYTQANRVTWAPAASTAQLVTNASPMLFDINATVTIYGVFVVSNNTKGGTSGLLWATGAFSAPDPCTPGEQLKITYGVAD
jgi:hypothetical protein